MKHTDHEILCWDKKSHHLKTAHLLGEEPLSIWIEGKPYSVIMRTPGNELAHAAGFCLGEGIVDHPDDLNTIGYCDDSETNVVTITLNEARRKQITDIIHRRGFISQTSCGICGKEVVKDLYQMIQPIQKELQIDAEKALACLESLPELQPLREKTRASHAAVIYGSMFEKLSVAEDVGRHNALDKAIGQLFLEKRLDSATLLVLSSRISYELVQKAARARIPIILAVSRPTSLAVALASRLNITIGCLADDTGLYVYCGKNRFFGEGFPGTAAK
ncbi:MAG: formate dehydrogenase accessory sulfurtransferase FdhD [Deltaproteobacteria bacterium]|nr:formate dehydrogenase accessory sulfurtransferase FdhD [Deltaproteobacteria bacterium]